MDKKNRPHHLRNASLITYKYVVGACVECGGRVVYEEVYNSNTRVAWGGMILRSEKHCEECGHITLPWWKRLSATARMKKFLRVAEYNPNRWQ
jgi:hypothetical protein